jgi:hypothetical protein
MKKTKTLYWIFTILFAGFMIYSGYGGVKPTVEAVQFMHDYLGYPIYFIQFISVAKIIGGIALLIPGLPAKIKEWAYAGLFFDLAGAIFSLIAVMGKLDVSILFILLPVLLGIFSYVYWKKLGSNDNLVLAS